MKHDEKKQEIIRKHSFSSIQSVYACMDEYAEHMKPIWVQQEREKWQKEKHLLEMIIKNGLGEEDFRE